MVRGVMGGAWRRTQELRGFHFATVDTISTAALGAVTGPCGQVASLLAGVIGKGIPRPGYPSGGFRHREYLLSLK